MVEEHLEEAHRRLSGTAHLANYLTRVSRYWLYGLSFASAGIGLIASILLRDWNWFARSGAAITFLSLIFAALALRHTTFAAFLAHAGEIKKMDSRPSTELMEAVERRLLAENIAMAGAGTLLWGFGDLLRYAFPV